MFIIKHLLNDKINAKKIRLVGGGVDKEYTDKQVSLEDALNIADEAGLDLVMVGGDTEMAVCKLMDYSKYLYEQHKREKQNHKPKQEVKEVRISPTIADNDLAVKAKTAERILKEKDKVKITLIYKGRQAAYMGNGVGKVESLLKLIKSDYEISEKIKIEGNKVYTVIEPLK